MVSNINLQHVNDLFILDLKKLIIQSVSITAEYIISAVVDNDEAKINRE